MFSTRSLWPPIATYGAALQAHLHGPQGFSDGGGRRREKNLSVARRKRFDSNASISTIGDSTITIGPATGGGAVRRMTGKASLVFVRQAIPPRLFARRRHSRPCFSVIGQLGGALDARFSPGLRA